LNCQEKLPSAPIIISEQHPPLQAAACDEGNAQSVDPDRSVVSELARALARGNCLQVGDVDLESAELQVQELRAQRPGMSEAYWRRALVNKLIDAARRHPDSLDELSEREKTQGWAVAGADAFGRQTPMSRWLTRNFAEDGLIAYLDQKRPAARVLESIVGEILDRAEELVSINRELPHDEYIARLKQTRKIGRSRLRQELVFSSDRKHLLTAWITTDLARQRSWVTVSAWNGESVPASIQLCVSKFIEGAPAEPV